MCVHFCLFFAFSLWAIRLTAEGGRHSFDLFFFLLLPVVCNGRVGKWSPAWRSLAPLSPRFSIGHHYKAVSVLSFRRCLCRRQEWNRQSCGTRRKDDSVISWTMFNTSSERITGRSSRAAPKNQFVQLCYSFRFDGHDMSVWYTETEA